MKLGLKKVSTTLHLFRLRPIVRRTTFDHATDVSILKDQSVLAIPAVGLIGKTLFEKGAVKPISRAVAGKNPAGPVGAMSTRRQAQHDQLRV